MDYIHEHIVLNGRLVAIADICEGQETPLTDEEDGTCLFIREWLTGRSAFEFQTSGSTGAPKKITFRREQMRASASATLQKLGLAKGEAALVCLSAKYVAGKMMLVRAFTGQLKIIVIDPTSNPVAKISPDVPIHFAAMVPAQVHSAFESGLAKKLNSIRILLLGGAPTVPSLRLQIREQLTSAVYFSYGMTETLSHIALECPDETAQLFTPLAGIVLSTDERGCLVIKAPYLDDPVVTHDVVELFADGRFRFLGRHDNMINSGGFKLFPETVEEKISTIFRRLNIQNRFFVTSRPDDKWGESIVLFLEGEPFTKVGVMHLKDELRKGLQRFEFPGEVVFIEHFSYTETGKINRADSSKKAIGGAGSGN